MGSLPFDRLRGNFPAGGILRGKEKAFLDVVACQFFLLRVPRVESLLPVCCTFKLRA